MKIVDPRTAPYAVLLLRIGLGGLFIAHASQMLSLSTPVGAVAYFNALGLPGWFANFVVAWELLGASALFLGFMPRLTALAMIPIPLGEIVVFHGSSGFFFSGTNGGWGFPALWILALIAQALIGDGVFAIEPTHHLFDGWSHASFIRRHKEEIRRTRQFKN